jgi:hypothetical protein
MVGAVPLSVDRDNACLYYKNEKPRDNRLRTAPSQEPAPKLIYLG